MGVNGKDILPHIWNTQGGGEKIKLYIVLGCLGFKKKSYQWYMGMTLGGRRKTRSLGNYHAKGISAHMRKRMMGSISEGTLPTLESKNSARMVCVSWLVCIESLINPVEFIELFRSSVTSSRYLTIPNKSAALHEEKVSNLLCFAT